MKTKTLIFSIIAISIAICSCSNEKKEFEKCSQMSIKLYPKIDTAYKQLTFGMSMAQYEAAKDYYTPMDIIDFVDSKAIGEPMNVQFGEHDSLDLIRVRYHSDNEYIMGASVALYLQMHFMKKYSGACILMKKKQDEESINLRKSNMDILIESEGKYCFVTFRNLK